MPTKQTIKKFADRLIRTAETHARCEIENAIYRSLKHAIEDIKENAPIDFVVEEDDKYFVIKIEK